MVACIDGASEGCLNGRYAAMVTAPVHKAAISQGGIPFSGHTERIAELAGVARVVMLLVAGALRVALATTHLPLRAVADAIEAEGLTQRLRILHQGLQRWFDLPAPRIAVLGLNPHAGEDGLLGREEIEVIGPVINALKEEGLTLSGPWPADTAFVAERLPQFDAVMAMYHDQGLRSCGQRHSGPALFADFGRSRHRAGSGRPRRRQPRQPVRGHRTGDRRLLRTADSSERRNDRCLNRTALTARASALVRISSMIGKSLRASWPRLHPRRMISWSKSAPGRPR